MGNCISECSSLAPISKSQARSVDDAQISIAGVERANRRYRPDAYGVSIFNLLISYGRVGQFGDDGSLGLANDCNGLRDVAVRRGRVAL